MSPLGIAVVGCGQIADAHLQQIARLRSGRAVAVCDTEPELAEQAADRFGVPHRFTDLDAMLDREEIDVVHLCTPVRSHAPLAIKAMRAGKHVYVEKPFAVDAREAADVVAVARQTDRRLCLGHDQLFDPVWLRAAGQIEAGRIGRVVHVESVLGYPIGGAFGREIAADASHWVRSLPGQLFQNTLSHPLYRLTEFLDGTPGDDLAVRASWFTRPGGLDLPSEIRVQLWNEQASGSITFLSAAKPSQRISRIYGEAGVIEVDFDAQTIRHTPPSALPGAFEKIQRPLGHLTEAAGNVARSLWNFARGDIHYFGGMRTLFSRFYDHIRQDAPAPIELDEMVRVTAIMDAIFESAKQDSAHEKRPSASPRLSEAVA